MFATISSLISTTGTLILIVGALVVCCVAVFIGVKAVLDGKGFFGGLKKFLWTLFRDLP